MKMVPLILFGLTVVGQWAVPLAQIRAHEQILAQGALIRLKCSAPDPYDPLRGRYLAVRPEQGMAPVLEGQEIRKGGQGYAVLETGNDGLARVSALSSFRPASGDFIRVKAGWRGDRNEQAILWPFDRFYINEKLAPEADEWFRENVRGEQAIVAEVRVLEGRAVLADLTCEGRSFREILKERVR